MSNMIQPSYGVAAHGTPTKAREARGSSSQVSGFLDLATRVSEGTNDVLEISGAESAQQKTELSEADEMRLFKKVFYEDLSMIASHPSLSNVAVNISDAAFQAMKNDPEYRS